MGHTVLAAVEQTAAEDPVARTTRSRAHPRLLGVRRGRCVSAVPRPMLRVSAAEKGSTTVLRVAGELDLATADTLREHVRACLEPGVQRLVLDLAGVEFVDVTGLGVFVEAQRMSSAQGGRVVLRRPRPMVLRMLDLLQLHDAFDVQP